MLKVLNLIEFPFYEFRSEVGMCSCIISQHLHGLDNEESYYALCHCGAKLGNIMVTDLGVFGYPMGSLGAYKNEAQPLDLGVSWTEIQESGICNRSLHWIMGHSRQGRESRLLEDDPAYRVAVAWPNRPNL